VRVKKGEKMGLSLFVNRRLEVQFLSPAPSFQRYLRSEKMKGNEKGNMI